MIAVSQYDYPELLRQLARAMQREFPPDLAAPCTAELKRVPWADAVTITEKLMCLGRYDLSDHLWVRLLEMVGETVARNSKKVATSPNKTTTENTYKAFLLTMAINTEIERWIKTRPPLVYSGEAVVMRPDGLSCRNTTALSPSLQIQAEREGISLELWESAGRPKMWCSIMDIYMRGYADALKSESQGNSGAVEEFLKRLLMHLQSEREKQFEKKKLAAVERLKKYGLEHNS